MKHALSHGQARSFVETLTRTQARGEFLFLNLRQLDGVALETFSARFGAALTDEFPHVSDFLAEGLLHENAGRIALTPKGLLVADSLFASFF